MKSMDQFVQKQCDSVREVGLHQVTSSITQDLGVSIIICDDTYGTDYISFPQSSNIRKASLGSQQ